MSIVLNPIELKENLNDENRIDTNIIEGFKKYDADTIPWSEREKNLDKLIA